MTIVKCWSWSLWRVWMRIAVPIAPSPTGPHPQMYTETQLVLNWGLQHSATSRTCQKLNTATLYYTQKRVIVFKVEDCNTLPHRKTCQFFLKLRTATLCHTFVQTMRSSLPLFLSLAVRVVSPSLAVHVVSQRRRVASGAASNLNKSHLSVLQPPPPPPTLSLTLPNLSSPFDTLFLSLFLYLPLSCSLSLSYTLSIFLRYATSPWCQREEKKKTAGRVHQELSPAHENWRPWTLWRISSGQHEAQQEEQTEKVVCLGASLQAAIRTREVTEIPVSFAWFYKCVGMILLPPPLFLKKVRGIVFVPEVHVSVCVCVSAIFWEWEKLRMDFNETW